MPDRGTKRWPPTTKASSRMREKRQDPREANQQPGASDALDEALMATFPASDPLSMVNTLIPGARDEKAGADAHRQLSDFARPTVPRRTPWREKHLGLLVTFTLVLIASLLILGARHAYVFEPTVERHLEGIVAVPPM